MGTTGLSASRDDTAQGEEVVEILCHDLRQLAALVKTYAYLLVHPRYSSDADRRRRYSRSLRSAADLLVHRLADVSQARGRCPPLVHRRIDLAALLGRIVALLGPRVSARHTVHVVAPDRLYVTADRDLVERVILNLLDNAARYSPDGGDIWLKATEQDGGVELQVIDEGVGIPPEVLPCVFERYYRRPVRPGRHGAGIGLGLWLCRQAVTAHGGHIDLHSVPGQGTCVTVWLPGKRVMSNE